MVKRIGFRWGVIFVILAVVGFSGYYGFPVSGGANLPVQAAVDLDGDGITEEYSLVDQCRTVREGEAELWRSPREWCVDSLALGDADNDGTLNMVITLWKKGSFGSVKPFWLKGEDTSYKNHLFVYGLKDKVMKQVWCSSDLDQPILSLSIVVSRITD